MKMSFLKRSVFLCFSLIFLCGSKGFVASAERYGYLVHRIGDSISFTRFSNYFAEPGKDVYRVFLGKSLGDVSNLRVVVCASKNPQDVRFDRTFVKSSKGPFFDICIAYEDLKLIIDDSRFDICFYNAADNRELGKAKEVLLAHHFDLDFKHRSYLRARSFINKFGQRTGATVQLRAYGVGGDIFPELFAENGVVKFFADGQRQDVDCSDILPPPSGLHGLGGVNLRYFDENDQSKMLFSINAPLKIVDRGYDHFEFSTLDEKGVPMVARVKVYLVKVFDGNGNYLGCFKYKIDDKGIATEVEP